MKLSPRNDPDAPEYPDLRCHLLDQRCRRRKLLIAAASLAVLGGAGYAGVELARGIAWSNAIIPPGTPPAMIWRTMGEAPPVQYPPLPEKDVSDAEDS